MTSTSQKYFAQLKDGTIEKINFSIDQIYDDILKLKLELKFKIIPQAPQKGLE